MRSTQVEEKFGLKKRHTYDEIVAWLNSEPKGVPYPNRVAFQTYTSHVYGQLKDSLQNYTVGQDAWNVYQHSDDHALFVPKGRASKSSSSNLPACHRASAAAAGRPATTTTI